MYPDDRHPDECRVIWIGLTQVFLLWMVWDIRRVLRVRALPPLLPRSAPKAATREGFPGAVPPARFVVVRWPDGHHFYSGCEGAVARKAYEHLHPGVGEEVEFWELAERRGHKVG